MLQGEHSAILSTFIKLPLVIKIFVLSIFEWLFYTGSTVQLNFGYNIQGLYWPAKYLNIEGFLVKSFKIRFAFSAFSMTYSI